jgi:hypothetical protein
MNLLMRKKFWSYHKTTSSSNFSHRFWWHICFFSNAQTKAKKIQKSHQANAPRHRKQWTTEQRQRERQHLSGFAKKRVQWLIEHSTSHQILWYVDSLVLRNPLLRKAANR